MNPSRAADLPPVVRAEYPFASNLLLLPERGDCDEARMHYVDEGSGPVVLMLHGNPTWSFFFRDLIRRLGAEGYRCIAPDHIGCGLSDKPQRYRYTLDQRIRDVEALVDHLGIDRFSLIVHDWGGAIGFGLAGRRPRALERAVVLNTAAFRSRRIPWRIALLRLPGVGEWVVRGLNGFVRPALSMAVTRPLPPGVRAGLLWPYRNWRDRVAVWNFVRDIPMRPGHPSHATLVEVENGLGQFADRPVLLAWGMRDFCFSRHFLRRWREIFPAAEVEAFDDCGHYVLDDGGDRLLNRIVRFFVSPP